MKTYEDAVKLLTSPKKFKIDLGLDRIEKILELLGNPQDKLKCIHVAGTNGKGSVCAIIATILSKSGIKTGLYTSPHIFDYTERIKINYTDISKDDFAEYVFEICNLADKNNINLTEFEILTAVMFKYFADNEVEVVVLETGLGGRFDATNVIKSNLCAIITHIDLDHTERLGNTKSQIAFEKAGIIKPNCPVFTSEGYEEIKDKADECNSLFSLVTPTEDTTNLSLKGSCQQENLSLALSAVRYLFPKISENTIQEALKEVRHPCRFQKVGENLIIDACHNPNGAMALRESLDNEAKNSGKLKMESGKLSNSQLSAFNFQLDNNLTSNLSTISKCYVFGCLRNKDYPKMMEILFSKEDEIYFYHFKHPNSCTIEELKQACKFPSKEFKSLENLPKDKLIVICGSFYMLNEIIPRELVLQ